MNSLIQPKLLKGFRDSLPDTEAARSRLIRRLTEVFESFGFVPIDTPALEYSEILLGKGGGETEKQVYRFLDNGHRDIALRYDLTVPFARFMAQNRGKLYLPFKRYHIAKVWRGENTQRGRYREFMQCDFDIVGVDCLSADFEILLLMTESMRTLGVSEYHIALSHRGVFNTFLRRLGLEEQSQEILRTVDKKQKIGEEKIKEILLPVTGDERGEEILDYIKASGSFKQTLANMVDRAGGESSDTERLSLLGRMIEDMGLESTIRLDPSITRGLDYYTGIVYETYLTNNPDLGSVCSGGRYNDLAALYTRESIPGVGTSIGMDRLLAVDHIRNTLSEASLPLSLLVMCLDESYLAYYHDLAGKLRRQGVRTEVYPQKSKLSKQFNYAERKKMTFALICGEDERRKGTVTLKDLQSRENYEDLPVDGIAAKMKELADREKL